MTGPDDKLSWWATTPRDRFMAEANRRAAEKSNADHNVYWRGGIPTPWPVDHMARNSRGDGFQLKEGE